MDYYDRLVSAFRSVAGRVQVSPRLRRSRFCSLTRAGLFRPRISTCWRSTRLKLQLSRVTLGAIARSARAGYEREHRAFQSHNSEASSRRIEFSVSITTLATDGLSASGLACRISVGLLAQARLRGFFASQTAPPSATKRNGNRKVLWGWVDYRRRRQSLILATTYSSSSLCPSPSGGCE
jgi:hypothetical protein